VEGAEVEMVKGMVESLKQRKILNLAIAVYHSPENPRKVSNLLSSLGYRINEVWGGVVYARRG